MDRARADFPSALTETLRLAAVAQNPEQERSALAAMIWVMMCSSRHDQEEAGIALSGKIVESATSFPAECVEAVEVLTGALQFNRGAASFHTESLAKALECYASAGVAFVDHDMKTLAMNSLERMRHVAQSGSVDVMWLLNWLSEQQLKFELAIPAAAPDVIHEIVNSGIEACARDKLSNDLFFKILQAGKGRRLAACLRSASTESVSFRLNAKVARLYADLRELQRGPGSQAEAGLPLDEDRIIARSSEYEMIGSSEPDHEIANVQREFEQELMRSLVPREQESRWLSPLAATMSMLDQATALLILYDGTYQGKQACWQFLVTGHGCWTSFSVGLDVAGSFVVDDMQVSINDLLIPELRREIQREPGPAVLTATGEELAEALGKFYLNALSSDTAKAALANKERLVVLPHGAGHFVPFHLLKLEGKLFADRWNITYSANFAQIQPQAMLTPVSRRRGSAVFALDYSDHARFAPLESSINEARAIQEVNGAAVFFNKGATRSALFESLSTCRSIHLRAHGEYNAYAASLQTVFLHPAGDDDGRLQAFELMGHDLRGLELVTFSVCETSLARYDIADNLRGLTSFLLLRGVGAVVGTLWPTLADASTTFFSAFYYQLSAAASIDKAFRFAQRLTRAEYPKFRDWGPFTLSSKLTLEDWQG